jgi:hypothetical protein
MGNAVNVGASCIDTSVNGPFTGGLGVSLNQPAIQVHRDNVGGTQGGAARPARIDEHTVCARQAITHVTIKVHEPFRRQQTDGGDQL